MAIVSITSKYQKIMGPENPFWKLHNERIENYRQSHTVWVCLEKESVIHQSVALWSNCIKAREKATQEHGFCIRFPAAELYKKELPYPSSHWTSSNHIFEQKFLTEKGLQSLKHSLWRQAFRKDPILSFTMRQNTELVEYLCKICFWPPERLKTDCDAEI